MKTALRLLKKTLPAMIISVAGSFVFMCLALTVVPHERENSMDVSASTVRLRVVANSDSHRDQRLKLAVRDGIIGTAEQLFEGCDSLDEAKSRIEQNSDFLEAEAERILKANGCSFDVNVRLVKEDVPVRRYSDFTFPAGEYETLRIDIGEAKGQNWWCVMYPPLCLSAATGDVYAETAVFKDCGFTDEQIKELKQPKKKVRFAIFEWLIKG